jgi:hypothetical protein
VYTLRAVGCVRAANLTVVGSLASGPWVYNFTIKASDQLGNTYTEDVAVFVVAPAVVTTTSATTGAQTTAAGATSTAGEWMEGRRVEERGGVREEKVAGSGRGRREMGGKGRGTNEGWNSIELCRVDRACLFISALPPARAHCACHVARFQATRRAQRKQALRRLIVD